MKEKFICLCATDSFKPFETLLLNLTLQYASAIPTKTLFQRSALSSLVLEGDFIVLRASIRVFIKSEGTSNRELVR